MNTLKARLIYALHMVLPSRLSLWLVERHDEATLRALHQLFPPV